MRKLALAKGGPVLGISGLDPHILAFSTPENAPTEISLGLKKKLEKKRVIKTTPKKSASTAFCAGPLAPKKKVGVEQEKVTQVIIFWIVPSWALPARYPTKHHSISGPARPLSPHVFFGGSF
jgi:hypothetical protein